MLVAQVFVEIWSSKVVFFTVRKLSSDPYSSFMHVKFKLSKAALEICWSITLDFSFRSYSPKSALLQFMAGAWRK